MRSSIRLSRLAPVPNKEKNQYRISIPFEPPNPYALMQQGSDNKAAASTGGTESQEGPKRASNDFPFSPDTVNAIERDPNQPPQVVIPDDPEVVIADAPEVVDVQGGGASSISPIIDSSQAEQGNVPNRTVTFAESDHHPGGQDGDRIAAAARLNKRPRWVTVFLIAVVVICVIIAVSTALAVAITATKAHTGSVGPGGSDMASPSDTASPSAPSHTGLTSDGPSSSSSAAEEDPKESPTETEPEETPTPTKTSTAKPAVCCSCWNFHKVPSFVPLLAYLTC